MINLGGRKTHAVRGKCQTLTKRRCVSKSYWNTALGRPFTLTEMLRLQGYNPRYVKCMNVHEKELRAAVGNGMPVNVLERIFIKMFVALGHEADLFRLRYETAADASESMRAMR